MILNIQLRDNKKSRMIDGSLNVNYKTSQENIIIEAQNEIYYYLKNMR